MNIDEKDQKILSILQKDGRQSFTNIAKKVGISDAAIHIRVKKMIKEGVIKNFTVNINEEILGPKIDGFLLLNIVPGNINDVTKKLVENKNVIEVYETYSTNDVMAKIKAENLDELRDCVKNIRQIPHISSTNLITGLKKIEK